MTLPENFTAIPGQPGSYVDPKGNVVQLGDPNADPYTAARWRLEHAEVAYVPGGPVAPPPPPAADLPTAEQLAQMNPREAAITRLRNHGLYGK